MAAQTNAVVGLALAARKSENKSLKRDLQKGLSKHTEHYAYGYVVPLAEKSSDETRLLRIAGLVASFGVEQGDMRFGTWLAHKNRGNTGEMSGLERRVLQLMNLNFDQAIGEIARILRSVDDQGAFNWFDLADTLFFWGKGTSDKSLRVRQSILRDFYRLEASKPRVTEEKGSEYE